MSDRGDRKGLSPLGDEALDIFLKVSIRVSEHCQLGFPFGQLLFQLLQSESDLPDSELMPSPLVITKFVYDLVGYVLQEIESSNDTLNSKEAVPVYSNFSKEPSTTKTLSEDKQSTT